MTNGTLMLKKKEVDIYTLSLIKVSIVPRGVSHWFAMIRDKRYFAINRVPRQIETWFKITSYSHILLPSLKVFFSGVNCT
jgi:cupin superfamily acireductone dioxygenase involved in methionine salvage